MKEKLHFFLCGIAMGAADVVPGVSGGTIAFITGIYPRLLNAIAAFNLSFAVLVARFRWAEAVHLIPWGFLLPLLGGIGASIFTLARFVTYLLETWPIVIWSFFCGLIVASILHLSKQIELEKLSSWLGLAAGTAFGWFISGAHGIDIGQSLILYFCSGFIAICAMILPGISGAFILVLLGQYSRVIKAVAELDIVVILVFALGCACGLLSFARIVNWLLRHWPNTVMAVLTGLMFGSLRTIWPWKIDGMPTLPAAYDSTVLVAALCCVFGMILPGGLALLARRK